MPSPFPGMDPYLEHPEVFPDFHDRYVTHLSEAIQAELPPPYYASLGRRVWIEAADRPIGPDVSETHPRTPPKNAGVDLLAPPGTSRVQLFRVPHDERKESFIEIYAGRRDERRLVTSLEVLSPSNKAPGGQGRILYLQKQQEILESNVHLVEIDLLRGGRHSTAVPERVIRSGEPYDFHVCVHRFDAFEEYVVYPILLDEHLPPIAVPLLPADAPVSVDLQSVFDRCYDAGPYRREIDYAGESVVPPLPPEWESWVQERLNAWE